MIFLQLQEVKDISMPGLKINGKRAFALSTSLVNISCSLIKNFKHRDKSIWDAISALDIASSCSYIVNSKTDSSSWFRYKCCVFQSIINTMNWVILHCQQKAWAHLRLWEAGVKESWGGMCKPAVTHKVVSFNSWIDVIHMDSYWNSHQHVLRSLRNNSSNL